MNVTERVRRLPEPVTDMFPQPGTTNDGTFATMSSANQLIQHHTNTHTDVVASKDFMQAAGYHLLL